MPAFSPVLICLPGTELPNFPILPAAITIPSVDHSESGPFWRRA